MLGETVKAFFFFFFVAVRGLYGSKLVHVFKTHSGNSTLQLLRLRDILGRNYPFFNRDKYSSFDAL